MGRASGARARRPGLRPGQARAAQRDPRALALGAVGVRLPGTRLGQRRDSGAVRHRRAEGPLPAAAAGRRDHVLLFDDRTAGRVRSRDVRDDRRPETVRKWGLGHQRGEVVFQQRQARVVLHRHGRDQARRPHVRQDVAVHRSRRDAGHRDHPQRRRGRRVGQARLARLRPLQRRPGAGRSRAGR